MKTFRIVSLSPKGDTQVSKITTEIPLEKLRSVLNPYNPNNIGIEEGSELDKAVKEIKSHGTFIYLGEQV